MPAAQLWWIRRDDRVDGPLTASEIRQLASQELIDRTTEISRDRQHWTPAALVSGLRVQPAAHRPSLCSPPAAPGKPSAFRDRNARQLLWIVGGIGAVCLVVLGLAILLVVALPSDSPETGNTAVGTADDLPGTATWDYWNAIRAVHKSVPRDVRSPAQAASAVEQIALRIEKLPTLNVDIDAVACGHDLANFWRDAGQQIRRRNSANVMAESFLRGLSGDPFGTAVQELQRQKEFNAEAAAVMDRCRRTRAVLTARYGVEFPSMLQPGD